MTSTLDVPARTYSLNVKFGRVSLGAKTISIPIKASRDAIPANAGESAVEWADDVLRNRRLTVELTNQDDQLTLFPAHDNAVTVPCIVETASLSIGETIAVSMNVSIADLTEDQSDQIWHLAQREGRVIIQDVSDKVKDDRDDDDDPDKQEAAGGDLFAAAATIAVDAEVGTLELDGKPCVTEKQAEALVLHGYGTFAEIVELRKKLGDGYVDALATTPSMSKAAAKRLSEVIELALAQEAGERETESAEPTQDASQPTADKERPRDGRLLCSECGQIWDTAVADDGTGESVIGEEVARGLDECPHCGSDKQPCIVRDPRVDSDGEFPLEHCERVRLCQLDGIEVDLLLVQDEFRGWRCGVCIEHDASNVGGYLPAFDGATRRDRATAIGLGKHEAIRELTDVAVEHDIDVDNCIAASRSSITQAT
jgi:hypothetical protein